MATDARVCEKRVLLVEDDPTARESIKLLLQIDRHKVTDLESGQQALQVFSSDRFDLAIIDFFMPNMQGGELAANLKRAAPGKPVVLVTAYAEKLVDSGMPVDAILPKPFGIDELRQTIARVVA